MQRRVEAAIRDRDGAERARESFRFFDTICGTTQERQDALRDMLAAPMDMLLVIGGCNSSNTSHLAEMGEAKLPTYFIRNAGRLESSERIVHYASTKNAKSPPSTGCPSGRSPSASPPARVARTT